MMMEREPADGLYTSAETKEPMPSSGGRVPQSEFRSRTQEDDVLKATPAPTRFNCDRQSNLLATPSRKFSKPTFGDVGIIPASSPLQPRHFNTQQFLGVPAPRLREIENFRTPTKAREIPGTPEKVRYGGKIQGRIDEMMCPSGGEKPQAGDEDMLGSASQEDSIYKSLGWDDMDDLA